MNALKNINLLLAFSLEFVALMVLFFLGMSLQSNRIMGFMLGVLFIALFVIIWGIWCAPNAKHRLSGALLISMKLILFALVTFGLFKMNQSLLALSFIFLVFVNLGLSYYFKTL